MTPHRYCSCGRIFDSVEARDMHRVKFAPDHAGHGMTVCLDPNMIPALQLGPGYTWRLRKDAK